MFDKEFYPTKRATTLEMIVGLDLNQKQVLEPQAGKGNIVEVIKELGAIVTVCEQNNDLARIVSQKANKFLKNDFFKVTKEEISHIDFIIMNPPFSNADSHIQHAWEIAPDGCQIISLCNKETLRNRYSRGRLTLWQLITDYGSSQDIGNVFSDSERETDVCVSLIKLYKPVSDTKDEFEGYFDMSEEYEQQNEGIAKYDKIIDIVGRYVGAVKLFDSVVKSSEEINQLTQPIQGDYGIKFGAYRTSENNYHSVNRDTFKKELQKSAWRKLFNELDLKKYVTSSVMADMNKFVELQENVPFKVNNVYKMFEMIVGTRENTMNKVIIEAFDRITKHHHENRYQLEGWKTNSEYRVNKKFIIGWAVEMSYGKMGAIYDRGNGYVMDDLNKALCHVTGTSFNENQDWWTFMNNAQNAPDKYNPEKMKMQFLHREFGTWYDWGFFQIKGFKKGSLHVKFKDENVWNEFNKIACKAKGFVLASKFTSDMRTKSTGVTLF